MVIKCKYGAVKKSGKCKIPRKFNYIFGDDSCAMPMKTIKEARAEKRLQGGGSIYKRGKGESSKEFQERANKKRIKKYNLEEFFY